VGVSKLPADTRALREAGMDPGTPAAMVERAMWPDARVAEGTLDTIVDVRDSRGIEPPGVTVIGRVAASLEQVRAFLADDPDREAET